MREPTLFSTATKINHAGTPDPELQVNAFQRVLVERRDERMAGLSGREQGALAKAAYDEHRITTQMSTGLDPLSESDDAGAGLSGRPPYGFVAGELGFKALEHTLTTVRTDNQKRKKAAKAELDKLRPVRKSRSCSWLPPEVKRKAKRGQVARDFTKAVRAAVAVAA